MGRYLGDLWRRRQFAFELARTSLRAQHYDTVFGQLWLVLNPLLLALVYFALVDIVRGGGRGPEFLAHIMAGLFAFRLANTAVKGGSKSVVGGGRLILNTAFPRALLPVSAVIASILRFLPMIAVYAVMHVVARLPVGPHLLWVLPILAIIVVFSTGLAMLVATAQVYFRDVSHFLRYFLRIWLYLSPVLWYASEAPERLKSVLQLNPLFPMLGSLSEVVNGGHNPDPVWMLWGLAWAVGALVVGGAFFVSRERDFAVRL
jgi:teichoic acid transport system permease protein